MHFLSAASYRKIELRQELLESANRELHESRSKLAKRYRELEQRYQVLVLRLGMRGYSVEEQAEVPAKPATLVLKKLRDL